MIIVIHPKTCSQHSIAFQGSVFLGRTVVGLTQTMILKKKKKSMMPGLPSTSIQTFQSVVHV